MPCRNFMKKMIPINFVKTMFAAKQSHVLLPKKS